VPSHKWHLIVTLADQARRFEEKIEASAAAYTRRCERCHVFAIRGLSSEDQGLHYENAPVSENLKDLAEQFGVAKSQRDNDSSSRHLNLPTSASKS
jgi:hypothetical protein